MTEETSRPARVLVADDQVDVREALRLLTKAEGMEATIVASPAAALEELYSGEFDAALIDLNYTRDTTSGKEGLDLLTQMQATDPDLPVIVMTAWGSIDLAVEAVRKGARDFIQKPWENPRLVTVLQTQVNLARSLRRTRQLEAENRLLRAQGRPTFIAEAASMRPVLDLIARVGPSDANILITGEHGTGKEVVAKTLHAMSQRAQKPLITVNTGALSEGTFESEVFGHVKGAFTDARTDRIGRFEMADGGTLFLDEIANVPIKQQAKLLRVLESGEMERVGSSKTRKVDVRVLSATNANLHEEVNAGRFRADLLFRLNTIEIHLPSLRDRKEDVPLLATHFLREYAQKYRKPVVKFEPNALQAILSYDWPGNVRELDHAIERAVLMATGEAVQATDLGLHARESTGPRVDEMSLEEVESLLVRKALAKHGGNVSHAAESLGLSRGALYRRIEKYGL